MEVGKPHTTFYDLTEHIPETLTTNEYGWGEFGCKGGSVSVWVSQVKVTRNEEQGSTINN